MNLGAPCHGITGILGNPALHGPIIAVPKVKGLSIIVGRPNNIVCMNSEGIKWEFVFSSVTIIRSNADRVRMYW